MLNKGLKKTGGQAYGLKIRPVGSWSIPVTYKKLWIECEIDNFFA
jgi:hypothetical protein